MVHISNNITVQVASVFTDDIFMDTTSTNDEQLLRKHIFISLVGCYLV